MKGKRQEKILELIKEYDIETQEELAGYLKIDTEHREVTCMTWPYPVVCLAAELSY